MAISTLMGSIELGLIFGLMSLGLFISFRILDLPDLTVDASFVSGVACSAIFVELNHSVLGILIGFLAGLIAGIITAILHTKLKVHAILSGILTMTAFYSVNLKIMQGRPSIFLYDRLNIFHLMEHRFWLYGYDMGKFIMLLVIVGVVTVILNYFMKTMIGLSLRATGDNEMMVRSSSINTDRMKILGFALANGLVAMAGALYTQYTETAVHGIGNGMLVLGLASIIIGEVMIGKQNITEHLLAVLFGSIIYRMLLTYAFQIGLPATDLKMFSALIVTVSISIPIIKTKILKRGRHHA